MNALAILAAIELLAPVQNATVRLVPDAQRAVITRETLAERQAVFAEDAKGAKKLGKDAAWRQSLPVVFKWRPTAGEKYPWEFEIAKSADFSDARKEIAAVKTNAEGIVEWTLPRANLEVAATYYWRVTGNLICWETDHPRGCTCKKAKPEVTSAAGVFATEDLAPRWMEVEGRVKNIRDLGGRLAEDGRRVRQGMVFRGQGLNDNSWDGRSRGRNRLTVEDVRYLTGTLGIRTDLDLRNGMETANMRTSPLGPGVKFIRHSSLAYKDMFTDAGKKNLAENFRVFCDPANYPIYFHCIAGADRTGSLAYILNGVLGVPRPGLETDWESTFYPDIPNDTAEWTAEDHFTSGIAAYGKDGDSWARRIELLLEDCGITAEEIGRFRSVMLPTRVKIDFGDPADIRAELRDGIWTVVASRPDDDGYEKFFYAHPEIAASGKPVVVAQRGSMSERARCWMRMFPDFIPAIAAAGEDIVVDVFAPGQAEIVHSNCAAGTSRRETFFGKRPASRPVKASGAPGSFVYMNWNIGHFCFGRTIKTAILAEASAARSAAFRKFFDLYAPDVVGVCEYSREFDRAGGLARELAFGDFADVDEGPQNGYQCNAMALRRGKLTRREIVDYPKRFQKTYFLVEEAEVNGLRSVFVTSHLDGGHDEENRAQIEMLIRKFADEPRVVVAADFNVSDISFYEPFLKAGFEAANCAAFGKFPTHRQHDPARAEAIDNVFVKGWKIDAVAVGDYELGLSDHRAIVCALSPKDAEPSAATHK